MVIFWIFISIIVVYQKTEYEKELREFVTNCYSEDAFEQLIDLVGYNNIKRPLNKSCENLKTQNNQEIIIQLNENNKLEYIKIDDKYIYHIDKTVDIYDPKKLGLTK